MVTKQVELRVYTVDDIAARQITAEASSEIGAVTEKNGITFIGQDVGGFQSNAEIDVLNYLVQFADTLSSAMVGGIIYDLIKEKSIRLIIRGRSLKNPSASQIEEALKEDE